jgi:hypothetical protein
MAERPINEPRHVEGIEKDRAWYYVNQGSVDRVVRGEDRLAVILRLKRKALNTMLSELKPLRGRR